MAREGMARIVITNGELLSKLTFRVVSSEVEKKRESDYRRERIRRGKPFDQFCKEWITAEPPAHLPYFGSWDNPKEIYATTMGQRVKMPSDQLQGAFMLNPKDVRIAELEAELAACKSAKG